MSAPQKILVMAGSREAHSIVIGLLARGRQVIASLPETERMFGALPVPTRLGGFETDEEIAVWLRDNRVTKVIDASHAFDTPLSTRVAEVCDKQSLRYVRVLRPAWVATPRDRWQHAGSVAQAAASVPATARVFSNTGWLSLPDYAGFSGSKLFLRQTHATETPAPFPFVEFVEGHPPFSQFQEQALFEELRVTHLICRNVGGAASMSKLLAARSMGMPVVMVARVASPPDLHVVDSVADALAWEASE